MTRPKVDIEAPMQALRDPLESGDIFQR